MTYALLRHGQTEWNRLGLLQGSSDIPLNEAGRIQAREAAAALGGTTWRAIVSSPLARARETAEIIAGLLGIPLGPSYAELAERDYGPLEGTPGDEALARWPARDYPNAEPIASVVQRGILAFARIAADHGTHDVIVVGHGTLLRLTLAAFAGRPVESIHNGAIATIRRDDGRWTVLSVNGAPFGAPSAPEHAADPV